MIFIIFNKFKQFTESEYVLLSHPKQVFDVI